MVTTCLCQLDQARVIALLDRTSLLTAPPDRQALMIEIGLEVADLSLDGNAHVAAVLLISHLVNVGNEDAVRKLILRISQRMRGVSDSDLAYLQQLFGIEAPRADIPAAAPPPVPSAPVAAGLEALTKLTTKDPRMKDAAMRFSAVFETARTQIRHATGYKGLHDRLHDLQDKVAVPMEKVVHQFPADSGACVELDEYRVDFEDVNQRLRGIAREFSYAETDWLDALDVTLEDCRKALRDGDPVLLKRVIDRVQRQVALRLPRINSRLSAAAAALRLDDLVQALSQLRDYAAEIEGDSPRLRQFRFGVEALDRMHRNLTTLLWRHNAWQDFEAQLNAIEDNLEDLASWWCDLRDLVERITANYGDVEWIRSFRADYAALEEALGSGRPERVAHTFRLLRRQVGKRFYNTDADLKKQCDELSEVGEPLSTVLRVIE